MPQPPPNVRTIDTLQGVRFVLPSHPGLRLFGLIPALFGCVFSGFAIAWIVGAASSASGTGGIMSILFPLFGVPFVIAGLIPIGFGLTLLFGRPEFEIRADRFRCGPRLGPFHRLKWRATDDIERFEINHFGTRSGVSKMNVLRVHVGEARPLNVTGSPHPAWLEQLAGAIVARIDRGGLADEPPPIVTRDRDPELDAEDGRTPPDVIPNAVPDPGPPPEGCPVWIEPSPTGPTIFIPPRGLRGKPVPALLGFALFWLGITNVFPVAIILAKGPMNIWAIVGVLAFLSLFEVIGIGVLLQALSLARRRAILDITDDGRTLLVTRSGLFRSAQLEIAAGDIAAIQVQNSGTSINEQPLRQVTLRINDQSDLDLLTGAPEPHLQWLAQSLRYALRAEMANEQMAK